MPKIICTIPGAPEEIGGLNGVVKFAQVDGALTADVSDDDAKFFASIPGYALAEKPAPKQPAKADDEQAAEKVAMDDMLARATAAGLQVDSRWKLPRLTAEVERAEAAAKSAGGNT